MKKKTLWIISGLCLILVLCCVILVYATANSLPTISFANKTYTLKWSNKTTEGSTNEYLTGNETFDNYHTMITIKDFPAIKNQSNAAQNVYSVFKQQVDRGEAFLAAITSVNNNVTLVRYCVVTRVPKTNLECSVFNFQQRPSDNAVMVYQYTQRYFADETNLSPSNVQNVLNMVESDYKKIEPYITNVQMPEIVQKNIDASSSYIYGVIKK